MFYIVGLGNPGEKYEKTRHNVGRMALESLAQDLGCAGWSKSKHAQALYVWTEMVGQPTEFVLPETFMNKSGDTVQYIVKKHEAVAEDFIVVHDDIDLPIGEIKISKNRGAGGNNGVASIVKALGTKDFVRVRVGIAPTSFWTGKMKRPVGGGPLERFVLKPFTPSEQKKLPEVFAEVKKALEVILADGVEVAMNKCN